MNLELVDLHALYHMANPNSLTKRVLTSTFHSILAKISYTGCHIYMLPLSWNFTRLRILHCQQDVHAVSIYQALLDFYQPIKIRASTLVTSLAIALLPAVAVADWAELKD